VSTAELQTSSKRLSGPYKRLQTPAWSRDLISAKGIDLRATRDLASRRLSREWLRTVVRISVLLVGDARICMLASVATMRLLGLPAAGEMYIVPRLIVFVLFGQAAAGTYTAGRAHGGYAEVLLGSVAAVGARMFVESLYSVSGWPVHANWVLGVLLAFGLCVWRFAVSRTLRRAYATGIGQRRTLIVADRERMIEVIERFQSADEPRLRQVGHISPEPDQDSSALGSIDDLARFIEELDISYVVVAGSLPRDKFERVVHACFMHGTAVSVVPGTLTALPCKITSRDVLGWPLLELQAPRLHMLQVAMKRGIDIVAASLLLLVLAPLFGLIALAIALESDGPILFRQSRPGLGGKRFWMLKFRTMRPDAEAILERDPALLKRFLENDCKLPPQDDPRISPVGALLRRTSLDELPQLWNVLRGDMSLIGPRPVVGPELEQYGEWVSTVLGVRPGMTGYWQVAGRSNIVFPERAHLDIYYVTRWSLGLDFKILALTIPAVFRRSGAF
jgi:exopolysaccharide production protein ExoY